MDKEITVKLTQEEANALYTAMVCRIDDFNEQMKEAGKVGNAGRVLECAKWIQLMEGARDKLFSAGATLWC